MTRTRIYKAWGACTDCGYEGMLVYSHVPGEDYSDPEALGVMMLLECPACESTEHSVVPMDYYIEIIEEAEDAADE